MVSPASSSMAKPTTKLKIIYLYCGQADRRDGLPNILRALGHEVVAMDKKSGTDLEDDSEWEKLNTLVVQWADFVLMTPPCSTFSPSRRHRPGPRILRTGGEPYGLKHPDPVFTAAETNELKIGTYHAIQVCKLALVAVANGCGFAIEYPSIVFPDQASLCLLEEAKALDELPQVFDWNTHQCPFGGDSQKPTTIKAYTNGDRQLWLDASLWCKHEERWQRPSGSDSDWTWCKHLPITGRRTAGQQWATSSTENYPEAFNRKLAELIISSGKANRKLISLAPAADTSSR
jgi:hypothetical protein